MFEISLSIQCMLARGVVFDGLIDNGARPLAFIPINLPLVSIVSAHDASWVLDQGMCGASVLGSLKGES
jgi:hypothetical protein